MSNEDEMIACEICEAVQHEDDMNLNEHFALCDDCHDQETYERNFDVSVITAHYAKIMGMEDVDFYNDSFDYEGGF